MLARIIDRNRCYSTLVGKIITDNVRLQDYLNWSAVLRSSLDADIQYFRVCIPPALECFLCWPVISHNRQPQADQIILADYPTHVYFHSKYYGGAGPLPLTYVSIVSITVGLDHL